MSTILVVSADRARSEWSRALQGRGYFVLETQDAPTGLSVFVQQQPAMAIVDIATVETEVIKHIRFLSSVPILVLTKASRVPLACNTLLERDYQADRFIIKPVPLRQLPAIVKALLRRPMAMSEF